MILVLRNSGKDIGSRHVDCLGGELHSSVCAMGACFFLILLVFAVDTDGTCAAGSGGTMCACVILVSAPVSIYVDLRYLRPHFYSYPLMPLMTGTGVLQVRAPKRFA
jgi:hypothetical protein